MMCSKIPKTTIMKDECAVIFKIINFQPYTSENIGTYLRYLYTRIDKHKKPGMMKFLPQCRNGKKFARSRQSHVLESGNILETMKDRNFVTADRK